MFRKLIIGLLLLFVAVVIFAQPKYCFQQVTTKDGLANNTILSIAEDKLGRIWFATYDGLSFFDGFEYQSVRPFIPESKEVLAVGGARKIVADSVGYIWVLFENNQLIRLIGDHGECILYENFPNIQNSFCDIGLDSWGNFNFKFNQVSYRFDSILENFVVVSDDQTDRTELNSTLSKQLKILFPDVQVYSWYFSPKGKDIWAVTINMGIFYIPNKNFSKIINYRTNATVPYNISSNEVYCVFEDRCGNIWTGSKNTGINVAFAKKTEFQTFSIIGKDDCDMQTTVRAIYQEKNGNLWIGTYNNGILIKQGEKFKSIHLTQFGKSDKWDWVRCIFQSKDQYIWVGTYAGLCRIHPVTRKIKYWTVGNNEKSPSEGRIYSIAEDHNGNLYLGEWGGLDYFNLKNGQFVRIDSSNEFRNTHIRKLYLRDDGNLWIGTETKGVFVFDTKTNIVREHFSEGNHDKSIISNSIFDIYEDEERNIWLGSFGGLNRIDTIGRVDKFDWMSKILSSTLFYNINNDKNHDLWCSTPKGIVKINLHAKQVRIYDWEDIDNISEFSEGAGFKNQDGVLFFGGNNGVVIFHPDSLFTSAIVPKPMLESVWVNGEKCDASFYARTQDSSLVFPFWKDELSINIKAIQINSPHKSKLSWILKPYDKKYHFFDGAIHRISYPNLAHGEYKLFVKTANADGVWSDGKKVLSFEIKKPFWLEYYFIILMACFLGICIIVISRIRLKQVVSKNEKLESVVLDRTCKIETQSQKLHLANKALEEKNTEVSAQRDQILAQRDHLLEMHNKLEKINDLKQKFFTNISHDIRTPLSLIKVLLADMLKNKNIPPEFSPKLEQIENNTEFVLKLINQILDKKKMEIGGLQLVYTYGNLVEVCKTVVCNFTGQASINTLKLSFISEKLDCYCRFDFEKLQQILSNLIVNAIKFTPNGGEIECHLIIEEENFELKVSDNGIGIPEDRIRLIFERYYQVGKSDESEIEGSGIGLSLVSDFVKILGGTINVDTLEGEGSNFTIKLPFLNEEAVKSLSTSDEFFLDEEVELSDHSITSLHDKSNKEFVLLVEDHQELRDYLKNMLSEKYNVLAFENGADALNYLKKKRKVELILSDWMMPKMDGVELCRIIKKKQRYQNISFILLTALSNVENQKEAYRVGVDEFIIKPFNPDLLLVKISNLLQRSKQIKEAANADAIIQPENKTVKTYDQKLLARLMLKMDQELSNSDFGQNELAVEMGMSQMQLYRKLKEHAKMSPNEFIRSLRIKRSKQLLEKEGFTINEVSDMVGFNDPKYFSRCFTIEVGMNPSKYRNIYLDENKY